MSNTDGLNELADAFAEFVRRARRARISHRDRERLLAYVTRNAHLIAPAPKREVSENEVNGSAVWRDLGYR